MKNEYEAMVNLMKAAEDELVESGLPTDMVRAVIARDETAVETVMAATRSMGKAHVSVMFHHVLNLLNTSTCDSRLWFNRMIATEASNAIFDIGMLIHNGKK